MKQKLLILLCALIATITASAYDFEYNGIYYEITDNSLKTVAVTDVPEDYGYNYSGLITIPSTVIYSGTTYKVTSIGNYAFASDWDLTSVTIPNSVTSIGRGAFNNCVRLTSVTIGNSVITIGECAFQSCYELTSVTIPNSVTTIGAHAFDNCWCLTSVTIPNSVTQIGKFAFSACRTLASFYGNYASDDNRCLIIDGEMIAFAPYGLSEYSIPNYVTSIGDQAMYNCRSLTSVYIPTSVTSIGKQAFGSCINLTSVYIPNSVTSIDAYAFSNCRSLTSIEIPNSVTSIRSSAFSGCSSLTSIEIPNSVTSISASAFRDCSSLTSIEIPNSVTSIGEYAFSDCSSLTSIEIPESVTSIGRSAFSGCTGLSSVSIPNSVTSIDDYAFSDCSSLTSIEIPNSVTSIDEYAFYYCSKLTSVTVENENPANITLGSSVFSGVPTSTCTLYVLSGSKELYAAAAQWSAFTNIEEFTPVTSLADGEAYTATEDQFGVDVNYTRNFNNTEWQPLYVPFNMSYEEWSTYAEVAEVHNVLGYDTDNDGMIDDIIIEFNKVTSGEIVPNVPYVIKAKNEGEVTFECTGKTVLAAPAEEGTVECSSTKMTYSFHGVYQPKTDMWSSGAYHLSGGAFHHTTTDEAVLPPFRFYMMVTPKTGGYNPASAPQMIRMKVDGEDITTSIEGIKVDAQNDDIHYDLLGRKIVNPAQGIYIKNGKKVFVK